VLLLICLGWSVRCVPSAELARTNLRGYWASGPTTRLFSAYGSLFLFRRRYPLNRYLFQNLLWPYMIFKIFISPYQVVDNRTRCWDWCGTCSLTLGVPTSLPNWYSPTLQTGGTGDQSPRLVQLFTEVTERSTCGVFHHKSRSPQVLVVILFMVGSKVREHSTNGQTCSIACVHSI